MARTRGHNSDKRSNKGTGLDGDGDSRGEGDTHKAEGAARLGFGEPPWRRQDGADGTRMAGQQCATPQLGERDEGDAGPHQGGAAPPAAHPLQRRLPGADRRQVRWLLHFMLLPPGQNQVRHLSFPFLFPNPCAIINKNSLARSLPLSLPPLLSLSLVSLFLDERKLLSPVSFCPRRRFVKPSSNARAANRFIDRRFKDFFINISYIRGAVLLRR